ncbi:MAG: FMN-binding protein [Treponema sp.]|nr:MAG: FMN-binding protein [Treponema sp.]
MVFRRASIQECGYSADTETRGTFPVSLFYFRSVICCMKNITQSPLPFDIVCKAAILAGCLLSCFLGSDCALTQNIDSLEITTPDLSLVRNGTWEGSCKTSLVSAKTAVTVDSGKMTAISILEHENGLGGKAEGITSRVVEKQSLEVDAVSGATHSSRVILKSVQNALESGIGK